MRVLYLHVDYIKFKAKKPAIKTRDEPSEGEVKEALVCFTCVEKGDEKNKEALVEEFLKNLKEIAEKVGVKRVVIYPYAHLSSELANPIDAKEILDLIYERCKEEFECYKAPFGWYKEFEMRVKGHPLAELSRTIKVEEKREVKKKEKEYYIIDGEEIIKVTKDIDLSKYDEEFGILVKKEALGEPLEAGEPKIIEVLKKFGVDWEPMSDYGHHRYGPKFALMIDLVSKYAIKVAKSLGIPVYIVKGTNMFDLKEKPIKEHAELFGSRMYVVKSDKGELILRYAACFQQFAMIKDWVMSHKNIPFGALEIADSYRLEQRGEVDFGFRLRRFLMPDLHIFCRDEKEAMELGLRVHEKIMEEMEKKIGRKYWLLVNVSSPEVFERYKEYLINLSRKIERPLLICVYKGGENYYWTINIEYNIIDYLKRPREIGTWQIDLGNAKRFGIFYYDEDGQKKHPVIIHTALIGSVERYLYAIFDTAIQRDNKLPFWLTPSQVRIIPVSEKYLDFAREVAKKIEEKGFRVEIDDRDLTVNKKIREAELDWVYFIVVVGEKEKESGLLPIRERGVKEIRKMTLEEFIKYMEELQKDYPREEIYWAREVSAWPSF